MAGLARLHGSKNVVCQCAQCITACAACLLRQLEKGSAVGSGQGHIDRRGNRGSVSFAFPITASGGQHRAPDGYREHEAAAYRLQGTAKARPCRMAAHQLADVIASHVPGEFLCRGTRGTRREHVERLAHHALAGKVLQGVRHVRLRLPFHVEGDERLAGIEEIADHALHRLGAAAAVAAQIDHGGLPG